jgi:hypothetical protein
MDLFEGWEARPAPASEAAVSFGDLEAGPPAPMAHWRLDLPAQPAAAWQTLAAGEARARARSAGLDQAPARLEQLLLARQNAQAGAADFAAPSSPAVRSEADFELSRWLDEAQGSAPEGAPVSYALEPGEAAPSLATSLERWQQLLAYAAWVETRVEGRLLGQSVVAWTGDLRTAWEVTAAPEQRRWHSRSLRLALASRGAIVRAFIITAQSAVKVATLLALPGGPALALPAAWTYVNRILAEVGEYRKLVDSTGD